jgi:hypothetical protein
VKNFHFTPNQKNATKSSESAQASVWFYWGFNILCGIALIKFPNTVVQTDMTKNPKTPKFSQIFGFN